MSVKRSRPPDRTRTVVQRNLARIKLFALAGPLLCDPEACARVLRLLRNRRAWGTNRPRLMIAVHRDIETDRAERFCAGLARDLADVTIVRQKDHSETVANGLALYRKEFDAGADDFTAKRHCLFLTRRGGKGEAEFISPFTGGGGTTCGEWMPVVDRKPDGTVLKGFMKASVAIGFCPVECSFCYLQFVYTEAMDIALNLDELADELRDKWRGYKYPINFGETGGLVEYDEWFAGEDGDGSIVQFIIDSCAAAEVTPFFLTKIRYPRYLRFHGKVQVGISLMPEPVRVSLAPHGSPSAELLDGLAWAVSAGACHPVIRLLVLWEQRELYPALLQECCRRLGTSGWRLTLDILRFSPATARTIAERHPEAAALFALELAPEGGKGLAELAREGRAAREKKIRPPVERQSEIYTWFREELNRLGCPDVMLTPCKGDPEELLPLVHDGVICASGCACHHPPSAPRKRGLLELPLITAGEGAQR
jgi:hypothetical protein